MINKLKKIKRARAQAGFTLIETLVAVLILATAIAGPLTIASRGLTTALVAKDQVTAFYLAQDAVEYIRFKRDSACLAAGVSPCDNAVWLSTLTPACTGSNGCYLDSTETTTNPPLNNGPLSCGAIPCSLSNHPLYYDPVNNRFTYTSLNNIRQPFVRTVILTSVNSNEEKLSVTVSWNDTGGVPRSVSVNEDIFNWE